MHARPSAFIQSRRSAGRASVSAIARVAGSQRTTSHAVGRVVRAWSSPSDGGRTAGARKRIAATRLPSGSRATCPSTHAPPCTRRAASRIDSARAGASVVRASSSYDGRGARWRATRTLARARTRRERRFPIAAPHTTRTARSIGANRSHARASTPTSRAASRIASRASSLEASVATSARARAASEGGRASKSATQAAAGEERSSAASDGKVDWRAWTARGERESARSGEREGAHDGSVGGAAGSIIVARAGLRLITPESSGETDSASSEFLDVRRHHGVAAPLRAQRHRRVDDVGGPRTPQSWPAARARWSSSGSTSITSEASSRANRACRRPSRQTCPTTPAGTAKRTPCSSARAMIATTRRSFRSKAMSAPVSSVAPVISGARPQALGGDAESGVCRALLGGAEGASGLREHLVQEGREIVELHFLLERGGDVRAHAFGAASRDGSPSPLDERVGEAHGDLRHGHTQFHTMIDDPRLGWHLATSARRRHRAPR